MQQDKITYLKAQCHCGISTFHVGFETASLPLPHYLCHCKTCRHVSGQMVFYHLPILGPPLVGSFFMRPVNIHEGDLTGYRVSPTTVHYFCHNCSAGMFLCVNNSQWLVSGGSLAKTEGITELKGHVNLAETRDGGIADQIPDIDGKTLPRYSGEVGSEELPMGWRSELIMSREEAMKEEYLPARCFCGQIKLFITKPNKLSAIPFAPYPDILFPEGQTRLATRRNAKDEKWWLYPSKRTNVQGKSITLYGAEDRLRPSASTKYLAGHCVCDHCRTGSGCEVQSWAFVSRANVIDAKTREPVELIHEPDRPPGLLQHSSSPGQYTEFCGRCGATVFWWHVGRPDVIDVSIGLLDEKVDGVRAEEWLKWNTKRLGFEETATFNNELARNLAKGMQNFVDYEKAVAKN